MSRQKFPTVRVVSGSVGGMSDLPVTFVMSVAFPLSGQGRPPQQDARKAENAVELTTQPG
jgi:hypothetical protein